MSESGFHRPRRALAHDTGSDEPIAADDTGAASPEPPRRELGSEPDESVGDIDAPETPGEVPDDSEGDPQQRLGDEPRQQENPFARPGSDSGAADSVSGAEPLVPAPVPVLPEQDFEDVETTGLGRRMGATADGPTPGPRRSAVSSATPPEREPEAAPATEEPQSWVRHHKRTLLIWIIGALVAALLIVFGFYLAGRSSTEPTESPTATATTSPSTSVSPVAAVTGADLITVDDADKIVPGASWAVAHTAESRDEAKQRPACLSTDISDVNPTDTFQRSMGTSEKNSLAALHQIDVYANAGAARQAQLHRAENLAKCDELPAYIESATTITGLGDDVTQVTVVSQDDPAIFHTVLLVRTGRALSMLDVTREGEAVGVDGAVDALQRPLDDLCSRVDGLCPTDPAVADTVPPPADPEGWLIAADLQRLRPGYGRWTATDPADITSKGMGCEDMTLASEPGPATRQQRTYLLTQDDKAPSTFGVDEMVFNFDDNPTARAFTTKLIDSLLTCKDRGSRTAKVTDGAAVNGKGADGVAVSARMITIDQATSDDASVRYQLVVAIGDTRVSYLLATVTEGYQFSDAQIKALALRTAQRNSQGND